MNRRGSTTTGIVETKRDNTAPSGQGKTQDVITTEFKEMPKDEAKKIM